jgi:hypothetical protein
MRHGWMRFSTAEAWKKKPVIVKPDAAGGKK